MQNSSYEQSISMFMDGYRNPLHWLSSRQHQPGLPSDAADPRCSNPLVMGTQSESGVKSFVGPSSFSSFSNSDGSSPLSSPWFKESSSNSSSSSTSASSLASVCSYCDRENSLGLLSSSSSCPYSYSSLPSASTFAHGNLTPSLERARAALLWALTDARNRLPSMRAKLARRTSVSTQQRSAIFSVTTLKYNDRFLLEVK